jgi:RsiW-degrading membrane proteinase PrsW (M82 family)
MEFPVSSAAPERQPKHSAASIGQAGFSLLVSAVLLALAARFVWRGLSWISDPQISRSDITSSFLMAASLALGGILLLPSARYALAQLAGRPARQNASRGKMSPWITVFLLGILFGLLLIVGAAVSQSFPVAWIVLPFVHLLLIGIPIAGVLTLGGYDLSKGSPQRAWGVLAAGMTLGPAIIFSLEIVALFISVIIGVVLIAITPGQYSQFSQLAEQLQATSRNPEAILPILQPYLKNPLIAMGVLMFMAGIVPLLEEALKPIGLWLLARRRLTPIEGFTAGLLSGAGFALVESLGYTSDGGQGWLSAVMLRAPTALMHITTCGLTGWGLAKAVSLHRFRWLLAGYGGAVAIHGLWNGLTITAAGIVLAYPDQPGAAAVAGLALLGMFALFVSVFLLLVKCNRYLRQQAAHAIISIETGPVSAAQHISSESESSFHEPNP